MSGRKPKAPTPPPGRVAYIHWEFRDEAGAVISAGEADTPNDARRSMALRAIGLGHVWPESDRDERDTDEP